MIPPARRAPLRGERSWRRAAASQKHDDFYSLFSNDFCCDKSVTCCCFITEHLRHVGRRSVVADHVFNVKLQGSGLACAAGATSVEPLLHRNIVFLIV